MSSNIGSLSGKYQRTGSTLTADNLILRICPRKHTTPNKPSTFPVAKNSPKDRGKYVSSLYSLSETEYKFDYQGAKYILKLHPNRAEVDCLTYYQ